MKRLLNVFFHPIATPHLFISLLSVAYLSYLLYEQKPPPIWSERCVSWKKTKNDCRRCCAAHGANYFTASMLSEFLLLLHFLRRACQSTWQCSRLLLLDSCISFGILTYSTIYFLPDHKLIFGITEIVGVFLFVCGFFYCSLFGGRKKFRAVAELICWFGGGSVIVLSTKPIRFDSLVVSDDSNSDNYQSKKVIPVVIVGVTLLLLLIFDLNLNENKNEEKKEKKE
jgi:hypothetical protein